MARTLLDLTRQMNALRDEIPVEANELKKSVVRVVETHLVFVTPVDTSKALSNWVVHSAEMWAVEIDAYIEGEYGSTQEQSGNLALQQMEQQLALAEPGIPVHITNNASYIRELNDGSSKQAPAGFVERGALLGRKAVKEYGLRLRNV